MARGEHANVAIRNRFPTILLSVVIGLAFILRFHGISAQSFWLDELFSVTIADPDGPISDMIARVNSDVHPPLFYFLLRGWIDMFGSSELGVRSFSAAFGFAGIVFAAIYYRKLTDSWTHVTFVALLSTSFGAVWYAQEARAYSLLLTLATVLTGATLAIIDQAQRQRRIAPQTLLILVAASVAAAYVHYFGMIIAAACFVTITLLLWDWKTMLRLVLLAGAVFAGASMIWLLHHYPHISGLTGGRFWIPSDLGGVLLSLLVLLFGNPWVILAVGIVALIYMYGWVRGDRPADFDIRPLLMIVLLCILFPAAISLHSPILTPRNLIIIFPAAYLMVAHLMNWIANAAGADGGWRAIRIGALVLLVGAMTLPSIESKTMPLKEQWREAASHILAQPECRQATMFVAGSTDLSLFDFYTNRAAPDVDITFLPAPADGRVSPEAVRQVLEGPCPIVLWEAREPGPRPGLDPLFAEISTERLSVERFYGSTLHLYTR